MIAVAVRVGDQVTVAGEIARGLHHWMLLPPLPPGVHHPVEAVDSPDALRLTGLPATFDATDIAAIAVVGRWVEGGIEVTSWAPVDDIPRPTWTHPPPGGPGDGLPPEEASRAAREIGRVADHEGVLMSVGEGRVGPDRYVVTLEVHHLTADIVAALAALPAPAVVVHSWIEHAPT